MYVHTGATAADDDLSNDVTSSGRSPQGKENEVSRTSGAAKLRNSAYSVCTARHLWKFDDLGRRIARLQLGSPAHITDVSGQSLEMFEFVVVPHFDETELLDFPRSGKRKFAGRKPTGWGLVGCEVFAYPCSKFSY